MKTITAYETKDGRVFKSELEAVSHEAYLAQEAREEKARKALLKILVDSEHFCVGNKDDSTYLRDMADIAEFLVDYHDAITPVLRAIDKAKGLRVTFSLACFSLAFVMWVIFLIFARPFSD